MICPDTVRMGEFGKHREILKGILLFWSQWTIRDRGWAIEGRIEDGEIGCNGASEDIIVIGVGIDPSCLGLLLCVDVRGAGFDKILFEVLSRGVPIGRFINDTAILVNAVGPRLEIFRLGFSLVFVAGCCCCCVCCYCWLLFWLRAGTNVGKELLQVITIRQCGVEIDVRIIAVVEVIALGL